MDMDIDIDRHIRPPSPRYSTMESTSSCRCCRSRTVLFRGFRAIPVKKFAT